MYKKRIRTRVTPVPMLTINDIEIITTDYLDIVIAYGDHVKQNRSTYENLPKEEQYIKPNALVLVKTKSDGIVGIKYNRSIETNCDSEYEQALHDAANANFILSTKLMLENGEMVPDKSTILLEKNLDITEQQIQRSIKLSVLERKERRLNWFKIEAQLVELDTKIKFHLGLDRAQPEAAEQLLEEILELRIVALMLLKHPHVVDMANRLRVYMGNVTKWNCTEDEIHMFNVHAEGVRQKANAVYKKFGEIFEYTGDGNFWLYYLEQLTLFKEQVSSMSKYSIYGLTTSPTSRSAFFNNVEDKEELEEIIIKLDKPKRTRVKRKIHS